MSGAGDVNGDGKADLIIGAYAADPNGDNYAGESYVVFGRTSFGASLDLSSLDGSNGFVINGIDDRDYSGSSVSGAGDVNGDGKDDLIIGAYGADPNGDNSAGESYVVFGRTSFGASVDLSSLNGSNGFVISGIDSYDGSGSSVSGAGDVNGDGKADLIIGAAGADPNGDTAAGESYVVFGRTSFSASVDLSSLDGSNGFVINGIDTYDLSGYSVDRAGDVNGDGKDDLIIGAYGATPNGDSAAGESYVVFGRASFGASVDLSSLNGSNGFVMNGIDSGDASGFSVSGAGDVNGDGKADLIIGAYDADPNGDINAGQSYVVFGRTSFGASLDLSSLDGSNGFVINGIDNYDASGYSVSGAGDVNGDGKDDVIIGAYFADPNGDSAAGESYVVFGFSPEQPPVVNDQSFSVNENAAPATVVGTVSASNPNNDTLSYAITAGNTNTAFAISSDSGQLTVASALDHGTTPVYSLTVQVSSGWSFPSKLSSLDGRNGFVINGIDAGDFSGNSVSDAGDVNGDGRDDLIIGAYQADPNGDSRAGKSYVVFGRANFEPSLELSSLDGSNGFVINGIDVDDYSGCSVGGAGDVNGDGKADLIIGAYKADPNGVNKAGESYVVFGRATFGASLELSSLDGSNGFVINGIAAYDYSGYSVSGAGDVNGDGKADMIIGAYDATQYGIRAVGESYVVFGRTTFGASLELSSLDGDNGFMVSGGALDDYSGVSVSGAGDVNGDGKADLIIGAYAADPNGDSKAGKSYVVFGRATFGSGLRSFRLSNLDGSDGFEINGIDAHDYSGNSVGGAGDLNGDGKDDLIIGAYGAGPNGNNRVGESYVVFGRASYGASLDLSGLDGSNGFVINGIDPYDYSGYSVSGAGDVNGDGKADLIIGAYGAGVYENSRARAGENYVVFGRATFDASLDLSSLDGSNGFVMNGTDAYDYSGVSVSGAGDVNGDGKADLIIGATGADPNGDYFAGESYVVFGAPGVSSDTATVTVSVNNANEAPVAADDTATVLEDSGASTIDVLSNDTDVDAGTTLSVTAVTQPSHGSTSFTSTGVSYTPASNYNGSDNFSYTVSDGSGGTDTGTVTVTVTAVNDAPSFSLGANPTVNEDAGAQTVTGFASGISVGPANESGQSIIGFTVVSNSNTGLFTAGPSLSNSGDLTYTPAPDVHGSATIGVRLQDNGGTSNGGVDTSATQSFTITVTSVNEAPVVNDGQSFNVDENSAVNTVVGTVIANDPDAGDTLTYSITGGNTNNAFAITSSTGQITVNDGSQLNYEVDDSYSLSVQVTDSGGLSDTATVTVDLNDVNDTPVLETNQLKLEPGDTVTLSSEELSASDEDSSVADLVFDIEAIEHGYFQANGTTVTNFLQSDVTAGTIQFVHDGSGDAPAYEVSVSDGETSSAYEAATIHFDAGRDEVNNAATLPSVLFNFKVAVEQVYEQVSKPLGWLQMWYQAKPDVVAPTQPLSATAQRLQEAVESYAREQSDMTGLAQAKFKKLEKQIQEALKQESGNEALLKRLQRELEKHESRYGNPESMGDIYQRLYGKSGQQRTSPIGFFRPGLAQVAAVAVPEGLALSALPAIAPVAQLGKC